MSVAVVLVEAARSWGGHLFVLSKEVAEKGICTVIPSEARNLSSI
jgi:hypothetical protein